GMVVVVSMYFGLLWLCDIHAAIIRTHGRNWFHFHVEGLFSGVRGASEWVVAGGMRRSLFLLLIAAMALGALAFLGDPAALLELPGTSQHLPLMGWVVWAVLVVGTLTTVAMHS